METSTDHISIQVQHDHIEKYKLIQVLKFTSERKRMSVLLEREHSKDYLLISKGADDVMIPRLAASQAQLSYSTQSQINNFAILGLRTLVVCCKTVPRAEATEWLSKVHDASALLENRQVELEKLYAQLEVDFSLLGATAIEDKLQDRVPEVSCDTNIYIVKH